MSVLSFYILIDEAGYFIRYVRSTSPVEAVREHFIHRDSGGYCDAHEQPDASTFINFAVYEVAEDRFPAVKAEIDSSSDDEERAGIAARHFGASTAIHVTGMLGDDGFIADATKA